jgi:hypothetical protein
VGGAVWEGVLTLKLPWQTMSWVQLSVDFNQLMQELRASGL